MPCHFSVAYRRRAAWRRQLRGLASLRNIEGYGNASVPDLIAGRLWEAGGASLLASGQWLATFAGWSLAAFFSLAGDLLRRATAG